MTELIQWFSAYSPAVALMVAAGAGLVFFLKTATEKAIASQFDRYSKEIELRLEMRSSFEEKILLDRYTVLRDLQGRIGRVMTDLNRLRHGTVVEGLMRGNDIVPLTEVFELLAVNKYLITKSFHKILWDQSQLLIRMANAKDDNMEVARLQGEYVRLLDEFYKAMNDVFGIDRISWTSSAAERRHG